MRTWVIALALLVRPAAAQFSSSGDQTITGQTGVGTLTPRATLDVVVSSADNYGLWISSQDGTPMFVVDKAGKTGIGTSSPAALLDVRGRGDVDDVGLQLRSGNSSSTYSSSQILFAYDSSGTYRHALATRHVAGQYAGNDMTFFLWRSTGNPTAIGDFPAMALQSSGTVHVHPVSGMPLYELVVSSEGALGAGTVMAAVVATHSSRTLKNVEAALSESDRAQAYEDVKILKHARFRYKGTGQAVARGLIYEDAPASIREPRGQSVIFDSRLANMEMALSVANRRIKDLEKKIAEAEAR